MIATYTHQDAPTRYVEANGIRFAYRRFGNAGSGYPLLFNQHYTGTMDYWDPAVTDGLAQNREVILFDNAGISSSSGDVPTSIGEMAANAIAFVKALGLERLDVLGFSIGGMVAQEFVVQAPALVRRLILIGTGLRGGVGIAPMTEDGARIFGATYDPPENLWLAVHFTPSAASQAAGRAFLMRRNRRQLGRDPEVDAHAGPRQIEALRKYGVQSPGSFEYLRDLHQPTLVVNGHNDVIAPTINSYTLQQYLPNAELILYPDANHGSFIQYHELFVEQADRFLKSTFPPAGTASDRLPFPTLPAGSGDDEFGGG
jgi:pimeloyl-ACP methyl ester carboxylesterase